MDWWKEEYTKMTEGTIEFIEHKQLILYGTKPLIVLSGFYNLLLLIFQRQEVESAGVLEKMWINLRLNFDNADVNSSTTLKATSSSSKVKVTSLVSATGLDAANQK
jgi:alpha-glucuronidase